MTPKRPPGYYANPEYRATQQAWRDANRERYARVKRERIAAIRDRMIAGYGGKCSCCGLETPVFLVLDHVEGGGRKDLASVHGHSSEVYARAIRDGFPPEYQLLCWNCNFGKHYWGTCPHRLETLPDRYVSPNNAVKRRCINEVRVAYGNRCSCCAESDPVFLTIDHVNGGGKKDYAVASTYQLCARIRRAGYPPDYQLLCWNCNSAKHLLGQCPHQEEAVAPVTSLRLEMRTRTPSPATQKVTSETA